MLIFILALIAMIMSWVVGDPPTKEEALRQQAAWADVPDFRQSMTTNIVIGLGGDRYLFFPSDGFFFQNTTPVSESKPRATVTLGQQTNVLLQLPQQRAIREQLARHGTNVQRICARAPQDVNAAIMWQSREDGPTKADAQKPADRNASRLRTSYPAFSLYLAHIGNAARFKNAADLEAGWKSMMAKIGKNAGAPTEVTEDLGRNPAETRYFAKGLQGRPVVSLWRVTPVEHAVYKYRIELEQNTTNPGAVVNTAIFASTDAITPCLDLSERISAHAAEILEEARTRILPD